MKNFNKIVHLVIEEQKRSMTHVKMCEFGGVDTPNVRKHLTFAAMSPWLVARAIASREEWCFHSPASETGVFMAVCCLFLK